MAASNKQKTNTNDTPLDSNKAEYDATLGIISAIPADELEIINIPINDLITEAEKLYYWAIKDRDELVKAGMAPEIIDSLQPAAGTLRFSEAVLENLLGGKSSWQEESPAGFELRALLLHYFLFAYRNDPAMVKKVHAITEGSSMNDMIQHLQNLSIHGNENRQQLEQIGFDFTLLDKAAELSARLGNLLGESQAEKNNQSGARLIRDQAYTYLKKQMGIIREYGKFVFYRDEEHQKGYSSNYFRKYRNKKTTEKEPAEPAEVAATA